MKIYYLVSLIFIFFYNVWLCGSQICVPYPTIAGPDPKPNFPQKYSTRVEVNKFEDDITYEMHAFYDLKKKKAALDFRENNLLKKLIFNYDTNEIYSLTSKPTFDVPLVPPPDYQPLYETTCQTFPLKESPFLNYYFGYEGISYLSPKAPQTFFRFEPFPLSYDGQEEVRGFLCDVYVSCQYNEVTKANYTIRHYFSKPNVTFPGNNNTFPRIIMRAKYSGVALKTDGSLKIFNNTFDYHEFKLDFDRDDIFQIPGRVFCENQKPTKIKAPQINGSLKFSEEIFSKGVVSHITKIEFDSILQIVRYESRDRFGNSSEINFDKYPHVFVNDYTIGVSYVTNKHTGICKIESLDQFAFASDSNFTQEMLNSGNGYALRSKSANSLLELDHDYFFTGQREIDGIMSDIFVAKSNISQGIEIINEYVFTSNNFDTQEQKNIPKRLAKKSPKIDFNSVSTFYNFETSEIDIHNFDVSKCYADDSLISFRIVFKPRTEIHLQILRRTNINKVLTRKIYSSLGNLTGEISLRFSIPKVSLSNDGHVYVQSAILPGPEPLKLFKLFPKKLLTSTGFTYVSNIPSAEACAIKCLGSTECLSFDYSNSSKVCYLNKKHYSNGTFSSFTTAYDHYSRNSLFYVKFSEKYIIWNDLNKKIKDKTSIEMEVKDFENQLYKIVLDSVMIEEIKTDNNRFGSTLFVSQFNLKKPNFKFKKNEFNFYPNLKIDECAKKCTEEIGLVCNSFHFCYLTSECLLNKNLLAEESSNFEENNYCDIYEKDALAHYSFFKTKAIINPNDKKINMVQSSSDCASKCDNEVDIHCRSFNFCPNTKECFLSERHVIDGSIQSSSNLFCDHYSRKYISDFTFINSNEIPLDGEIVLKEMESIDSCSFECVNSDGFSCKTFDYCPESKTCILNSGQKPLESNQDTKKEICAHYRREYFFATSSKSISKDSSKSILVALSLIFGIISIILGGIGSILMIKKFHHQ